MGYYAYVDGVWGIIYADLQAGAPNSSPWGTIGEYTLPSLEQDESYKTYTVSALPSSGGPTTFGEYTNANSNTGVIELASNSTGTNNRFYVMTTVNNSGSYSWWEACAKKAGTNSSWVLPTREKWSIFGSAFGITSSNYSSTYGLKYSYWSSTEQGSSYAWGANFQGGSVGINSKTLGGYVRLCTTF